ncbi:IS481 family transposase [Tahibacter sp. UC22_41]|uniref:IS481 family transposase n=1 Tax=Tahibacter sp. UC22_41 TaxID=3350178 RepID=UPI0036DC2387
MPWNARNLMSLRREFVVLAQQESANVSALCRYYGISRKTAYKWLERGADDTADRSRQPHRSPERTAASVEQKLLRVRDRFPAWGARKLKRFLENAGESDLPAVSTITAVLRRHGRLWPAASSTAKPWERFEHPEPNALWQMDFKGHVAMSTGRCHPLTVLDDHSRFNVLLQACSGESLQNVQTPLIRCFQTYGLPAAICCDNGSPWGTMQREDRLTTLGVWLIQLGIRLIHARPCHPQTNGKDERFHRTLNIELLQRRVLADLDDAQHALDAFRDDYNLIRPHQAIGMNVPASRYRPSDRRYPATLPPVEYDDQFPIRTVDASGKIDFLGRRYHIGKALRSQRVALRPDTENDGQFTVYFCHQPVRSIDLHQSDGAD